MQVMEKEVNVAPIIVKDLRGLNEMVGELDASLPLFFDTETTGYDGSDLRTDLPVALQFHQRGQTWIVDVRQAGEAGRTAIGRILKRKLGDTLFVGHNLKFDLEVLLIHFGYQHFTCWDTMLGDQVMCGLGLSDGRRNGVGFGLKAAAERRKHQVEKDTRGSFKNMHLTPAWNEPFTPEQISYMAQDVEVLPDIYWDQRYVFDMEEVEAESRGYASLRSCFDLEMEVLPALVHVEVSGVPVDWDGWMGIIDQKAGEAEALKNEVIEALGAAVLEKRAEAIDEQMEQIRAWEDARDARIEELRVKHAENFGEGWGVFKAAAMKLWREENPRPEKPKTDGAVFNLNSPAQLLEAFKELGIPAEDTTDDTLEDLAQEYPIIGKLRAYRKAAKFVQSFGASLRAASSSADGRLHSDYMQIGASSNRMSCTKPNFQQIPSRSVTGKALRQCVKASPGFKILTADFGSQELAIIADLSGDATMLRLFEEGADLHSETARMMFNLGPEVNPKKHMIAPGVSARDAAKTINYGLAYGQTEYGLALGLGIPVKQAADLIERWYRPYQGAKKYFDARKAQIFRGELYARTEHGWVRHFDPLPVEPVMPVRSRVPGNFTSEFREYKENKRAWDKLRRRLENKLMNTPVQGTGAGITKKALASFFSDVRLYNENDVPVVNSDGQSSRLSEPHRGSLVRIIAVVHDEIVCEAPEEVAELVALKLARAMDDAMRFYLKRVKFPASDVHIDDCWSK